MASYDFPPDVAGNAVAMAMWSAVLLDKGKFDEAVAAAVAAVEAAPDDSYVHQLARGALSRGVPTYHVPMLHDRPRNRLYMEALRSVVRPGMRVLEIGTGAGFLSLTAAKAGAQVITCERNPAVAAMARLIAGRNGLSDRIAVIGKDSSLLQPGTDLAQPADLLMSELFDQTLFGDSIVEIIADARQRLLAPDAIILPPRCELRCALIDIEIPPHRQPLGQVEGFDMSPFNLLAPLSKDWLRYKGANGKAMSGAASALAKDFTTPAPFGPDESRLKLKSYGGRVSGVIQWLRFDFDDGGAYENPPFDGNWSHWGQPVYTAAAPFHTEAGEEVDVLVRRRNAQVLIACCPAKNAR